MSISNFIMNCFFNSLPPFRCVSGPLNLADLLHNGFHQLLPWMLSKELIDCIRVEFDIFRLYAGRLHSLHALADPDELVDLVLVLAEAPHDVAIVRILGSRLVYFALYWE